MFCEDDLLFADLDYRVTASRDTQEERVDPAADVEHLTQAWINERAAPDVLQYEQSPVDGLLSRIEEQVRPTLNKHASQRTGISEGTKIVY